MSSYVEDASLGLKRFRLILVDDGSNDATWSLIEHLRQTATNIVGVKLSRTRTSGGTHRGPTHVRIETHVFPSTRTYRTISTLLAKCCGHSEAGHEICFGVRSDRQTDTRLNREPPPRITAYSRSWACSSRENHADFRLMSRKALQDPPSTTENPICSCVASSRLLASRRRSSLIAASRASQAKPNTMCEKMLSLAVDGITSFWVSSSCVRRCNGRNSSSVWR